VVPVTQANAVATSAEIKDIARFILVSPLLPADSPCSQFYRSSARRTRCRRTISCSESDLRFQQRTAK
jgi:hypothetical protein